MPEHRGSQEAGRCAFATQQDRVRVITQARALVASQVLELHFPAVRPSLTPLPGAANLSPTRCQRICTLLARC